THQVPPIPVVGCQIIYDDCCGRIIKMVIRDFSGPARVVILNNDRQMLEGIAPVILSSIFPCQRTACRNLLTYWSKTFGVNVVHLLLCVRRSTGAVQAPGFQYSGARFRTFAKGHFSCARGLRFLAKTRLLMLCASGANGFSRAENHACDQHDDESGSRSKGGF